MIGLVLICRDEQAFIERCLASVKPYLSHWTIVDTGSRDDTKKIIRRVMKGVPGELHDRQFVDFGTNRTEALALAKGSAEWLLLLDADMTIEVYPDLLEWLAQDPDPGVDAWNVGVLDQGTFYRLPLLVRGDLDWEYVGATHEYLDPMRRRHRSLLGLAVTHHSNRDRGDKHNRDLELLREGVEAGDARAIFYSAQALRFLGRNEEAIELYRQRAYMNGWEEEAWYAAYQAAKLAQDVPELLKTWDRRSWRAEPLQAAAEIVRKVSHDDVLFIEGRT